MARKATHQHTDSSATQVPVVLFGVDDNGKPKAARFVEKHADLAAKAAAHLKLHVLPIVGPVVADLAGRLPAGRIGHRALRAPAGIAYSRRAAVAHLAVVSCGEHIRTSCGANGQKR